VASGNCPVSFFPPQTTNSQASRLQACSHCHVESSPLRTEAMDRATAVRCLELVEDALERGGLRTLDITGGAPELSPQFRSEFEALQQTLCLDTSRSARSSNQLWCCRQPLATDIRAQPAVHISPAVKLPAIELRFSQGCLTPLIMAGPAPSASPGPCMSLCIGWVRSA
jgi:hypothetical protein